MSKKLKSIAVACTDEDRELIDECCNRTAFPPSRSLLALLLIREGVARVRQGTVTLEAIYQKYADSPTGDRGTIGG